MKFSFLSKYFPPPQFLKPPRVGISFSDFSIKAMSVDKTSGKPSLKSVLIPLEKGTIVSGNIVNAEEMIKKLSLLKKNFDSPFVFFTIPDELVYVFSAQVPLVSRGNLTESVAFILEENVPLALNDTIFDFVPVKVVSEGSGFKVSVIVAASARKEIEKFMDVFRRSGFEPVGCIHESQAIAKSVVPRNFSESLGVVHAREDRIGIHLVKNGIVNFSTIRMVSKEDYEKDFLDEYEKFLEYCLKYDTEQNQPIKSIMVCGEFDCAKKVAAALINSKNYTKDVKLSNVWVNAFEIDKYLPDVPYEKSLSFAGSIGAALSDVI